jgi:hypothetical protein
MRIEIRVIVLMAALAAGCTAAPRVRPVKMGPADSTLEGARQFLKGKWTLVSYEVFPPGRSPVQLGSAGTGTMTYDDYSNLDIQIHVTDQKVADALGAAGVPLKDGVISTTGRTALDFQNKKLTYILEGQPQLVSNAQMGPLAMNRPRYYQVEGDVLILTTKDDNGQALAISRWKKEGATPR